jgi:hypothetical protein
MRLKSGPVRLRTSCAARFVNGGNAFFDSCIAAEIQAPGAMVNDPAAAGIAQSGFVAVTRSLIDRVRLNLRKVSMNLRKFESGHGSACEHGLAGLANFHWGTAMDTVPHAVRVPLLQRRCRSQHDGFGIHGPVICKPTGRPAGVSPQWNDVAGWRVMLNGLMKGVQSCSSTRSERSMPTGKAVDDQPTKSTSNSCEGHSPIERHRHSGIVDTANLRQSNDQLSCAQVDHRTALR